MRLANVNSRAVAEEWEWPSVYAPSSRLVKGATPYSGPAAKTIP